MTYFVDRIEDQALVLENEEGRLFSVPKDLIPKAKEGDCVEIFINEEKTKSRQAEMRRLMDNLFLD